MIIDGIIWVVQGLLDLIVGALTGLLELLPDPVPPDISGALAAMAPVFGLAGWANKYVPLVEAGGMLVILGTVQIGMQVFAFASWAASKLHVTGGSS